MKASDIATRVRDIVGDKKKVRWSDEELLRWISDAQLFIIGYRPDAASVTDTMEAAAGTKQTLPAGSVRLLEVTRNVSSAGAAGRVITYIDRASLNSHNPGWHQAKAEKAARHYTYDNREPLTFYIYPPVRAGEKLEMVRVVKPTDVTALTDDMSINDTYREAAVSYVCFRCYCKDTEAASDKAQLHLSALSASLGIKLQKDSVFQPEMYNRSNHDNGVALKSGGV